MKLRGTLVVANADGPRVPAQQLSHPKDGALAQQPKAERAPHSAVVRPEAARKSRSTTSEPIGGFVSCGPGGPTVGVTRGNPGQTWTGTARHSTHHCVAMAKFELKECWFEPIRRRRAPRFLVQDRLRASDVLHRDWDWSRWL
jgi:hypothetical protein